MPLELGVGESATKRRARAGVGTAISLAAERDLRTNPCRAPRRQSAGQQTGRREQARGRDDGRNVHRRQPEQQRVGTAHDGDGQRETNREADTQQPQVVAQHQPHDLRARRAERQTDADLVPAAHGQVGDDAVQTDDDERRRQNAEGAGEPRDDPFADETFPDASLQFRDMGRDRRIAAARLDARSASLMAATGSSDRTMTAAHAYGLGFCAIGT